MISIDRAKGQGITLSMNGADLSIFAAGAFDFVFSSHTLEHIAQWQDALREWIGKLRPGGVIFLYLPHPDCGLWRMDNPLMAQYHAWIPTPEVVRAEVEKDGCGILSYDDKADSMYGFHVCGRKPD